MDDPYRLLGITRDASDDEIKKAYRTMSKKYHPDANIGSPHLAEYTEIFKKVQNAYDQIMNERKNPGMGNSFFGNGGGFGYQNNNNSYSSGASSNTDYQAASNLLNSGHYQEAYNILQRLENRDAHWYYLCAIALWGLRNTIAAVENAKKACEMDPGNQQYRMLLQQMQGGRASYQNMQSPFGNMGGSCNSSCCCQLMLINMCCGSGLRFGMCC